MSLIASVAVCPVLIVQRLSDQKTATRPFIGLVNNTSWGVAENALLKNREDTAASLLANGGAVGLEDGGVGWDGGWVCAVQVGNPEDIGSAALSSAV